MPAKVIKLVGLKNGGRVSPTNLITFAGTQNGEYIFPNSFLLEVLDLKIKYENFFSFLKIEFLSSSMYLSFNQVFIYGHPLQGSITLGPPSIHLW